MLRHRVLIVDDDDHVREALLDELQRRYQVDSAACGKAALEWLARGTYDAVISDLRMPDMSGLEVLDQVKRQNPEAVRILLTGHLDEDAHRATLLSEAPFKVGKPWHDQIEVTLRRGLEHREHTRRLKAQVFEAIHAARVEQALARETQLEGRARVLSDEAGVIDGVLAFEVERASSDGVVSLASFGEVDRLLVGDQWRVERPLRDDGSLRVMASGEGEVGREILELLLSKAKDWFSPDLATAIACRAGSDSNAQARLQGLTNRAALGQLSGSMLHELASVVGSLDLFVEDLASFAEQHGADSETLESASWARSNIGRVRSLFQAMRSLVANGKHKSEPRPIDRLVEAAVALCRGYVLKARAVLQVGALPTELVRADEPLLVQVFVNLIRNAAEVSPPGGLIRIEVELEPAWVLVKVTDHGRGLSPDEEARLFEPFFTTKDPSAGTGLGLAFSAQVTRAHGGTLRHHRPLEGGAQFVVTLPRNAT